MIEFTFAIVNWNTRDLLARCIQSILDHVGDYTFQILVLDNASTDGSAEMVKKQFPEVILVENDCNSGFALGHEILLPYSKGKYHILVNSDIELHKGCLQRITRTMKDNRRIGVLGPKIVGPDQRVQRSCRRLPSLTLQLWEAIGIGRLMGGFLNPYHMGSFDHQTSREVPQVMGSFFVIRSSIIPLTGFMDTRFFMYYEEVDFCKRVAERGFTVYFDAGAEVMHVGGGSSRHVKEQTIRRTMRSMNHYFRKHRGKWVTVPLALIAGIDTATHTLFAALSLRNPFTVFKAYSLGLLDIVKSTPANMINGSRHDTLC
ncbi:MAG: hypothetical protein CR997_11650 [Acidobacteria bacterium]|nr:MAG: hypothetical protein CR997_11650 [Acidobacteriota bacterium]